MKTSHSLFEPLTQTEATALRSFASAPTVVTDAAAVILARIKEAERELENTTT